MFFNFRSEKQQFLYSQLIFSVATTFVMPVYFLLLKSVGMSDFQALSLNIVCFTFSALLEFPTGIVADRFGYKFSTMLGIVGWGLSYLIYATGQNWWQFALGEFSAAVAIALISGAQDSWVKTRLGIDDYHDYNSRAEMLSRIVVIPAVILAGLIAGLVNIKIPFLISVFLFGVSGLIFIQVPKEPRTEKKKTASTIVGDSWKTFWSHTQLVRITFATAIVAFAQHGLFMFWSEIAIKDAGWSLVSIGALSAGINLLMALGIWIYRNKLPTRVNNVQFLSALIIRMKFGIVFHMLNFGLILLALTYQPHYFPLALLMWEIGVGWGRVSYSSTVQECIKSDNQHLNASISSISSGIVRIGSVFGLLMAGLVSDNFGRLAYFQIGFITLVVVSIWLIIVTRKS
jgi:MFS family permease